MSKEERPGCNLVIGFPVVPGALFIWFTYLKINGFVHWSWWLVTAPLWVPFLLAVVAWCFSVLRGDR